MRRPKVLADLQAQYPAERLLVLKLDVTKPQEISAAFQKAKDAFGRIDVVYNNAAYGVIAEVEGTTEDVARAMFETNFWGAANVSREAVKFFREVNKPIGGRLLTVSSIVGIKAMAVIGYYGASKYGEWPALGADAYMKGKMLTTYNSTRMLDRNPGDGA